jgi:CHAD domain-containing protein
MARRTTARRAAPARLAPGSARVRGAIAEQQRRIALAAARADAAAEGTIHDGRVAARRLRSVLKTFRPLLDAGRAQEYRADLRSFAAALGEVRESDVRRDLLTAVSLGDGRVSPTAHRRLRALLEASCATARDTLRQRLAEPAWSELSRRLRRQRTGRPLLVVRTAGLADVLEQVARTWRKPLQILRHEPRSAAELHELRLALKHCRYALETVAGVAPDETARLLRRLRAAQDRIGDHRDVVLAQHWLHEHEQTLGAALAGWLLDDLARRERKLRREGARRAARLPTAWEAWRAATRPVRKAANRGRG